MSTFNVTGSASGVFTSGVTVSEMASPSVLPSSSVVAVSSAAPSSGLVASSSVAQGSSILSARPSSSVRLASSTRLASVSSHSLSVSGSSTALASSVDLSSSSIFATSAASSSVTSFAFTSASVQSRPGDKVPAPLPVSSTADEASFTGVSTLSSASLAVSSVVPSPRSSRVAISPIVTTPSVSRTISDKVASSVASAQSAGVSTSRDIHPTVKAVATSSAQSGAILSMPARPTDIASSTDGSEVPHSASASGSSLASQGSSSAPSETRAGNDPAPPTPTSESSAVSSEASKPASSPSRPSVSSPAPTLAQSSSAATSASKPAATQDSAPPGSLANTSSPSLSQDGGNGASTTSLHAVSSPSAPTPAPAPTSHGHTQSIPEIPFPGLPITRAAPVVHSTTAAPFPPVQTVGSSAPAPPAVVPSSVSGPALTPLAQQDVPVHGNPVASATGVSAADTDPQVHAQPSPAHPTPLSPPSASPDTASSDGDSKSFDTVQANAQTPAPTSTSTITEQPDTTLSSPHFVTVTDADHHTSLSVPPLFTSVIVSELPDGGLVSVTRIIANPTGIYGVEIDSKMGFFAHSGAVAGVFLVVGAVLAAIALGIWLFIRRRRRQNPRFIGTISNPRPIPDNPFEDPRDFHQPQMRYSSGLSFTDRTIVIDGIPSPPRPARPPRSPFDDYNRRMSSQSSGRRSYEHAAGLDLTGVSTHRRSTSTGSARRTSSESRTRRPSGQSGVVGLAITSDQRMDSPGRARRVEPSSARSSPSFYPPSLPTLPHDDDEGALVDIVLDAGMGKPQLNRTGSTPSVHSVTRKPVPSPEPEEARPSEPTPAPAPAPVVSPSPITPAEAARPPVLPPRSPLRRNSAHLPTQALSPPPYKRPTITLDTRTSPAPVTSSAPSPSPSPSGALTLGPDTHMIVLKPSYEPLTPPTSLSSITPPGSSAGHSSPTPGSGASPASPSAECVNPFADVDPLGQTVQAMGPPGLPLSPRRDTFYTRRVGGQGRPSIEWK
ncbi:hypothetical protein C8Q78DRAFT_1079755 [Trametes maxima]|nr:hypothetical protein C8Q78DRAFT_1079755 [Trametes maxima]